MNNVSNEIHTAKGGKYSKLVNDGEGVKYNDSAILCLNYATKEDVDCQDESDRRINNILVRNSPCPRVVYIIARTLTTL